MNSYSYSFNNPLKYTDPTGLYGSDVHLNLTYYLALHSNLDALQSINIACSDQAVDNNLNAKPQNPINIYNGNTTKYHFSDRLSAFSGMMDLANGAYQLSTPDIIQQFGILLHTFQDSFSHEGLTWVTHNTNPFINPDDTSFDSAKAFLMAKLSFIALRELNASLNGLGDMTQDQYDAETKNLWSQIQLDVWNFVNQNQETRKQSDLNLNIEE